MRVIYREKLLKTLLSLSLPLALISLVVPTEPCQVETLRYKKKTHTHKYLKLNPPDRTTFVWHPNSRDLSYPEILTGAPNGEGREDKTYKLSKKNQIRRVVNSTLTYALSHGGYRIKYRVAWHSGLISWPAWGRTDVTISCVGVMAYLICCQYPAHPPADGSSTAKGSADTFGL